jgi:hypothetical protein
MAKIGDQKKDCTQEEEVNKRSSEQETNVNLFVLILKQEGSLNYFLSY